MTGHRQQFQKRAVRSSQPSLSDLSRIPSTRTGLLPQPNEKNGEVDRFQQQHTADTIVCPSGQKCFSDERIVHTCVIYEFSVLCDMPCVNISCITREIYNVKCVIYTCTPLVPPKQKTNTLLEALVSIFTIAGIVIIGVASVAFYRRRISRSPPNFDAATATAGTAAAAATASSEGGSSRNLGLDNPAFVTNSSAADSLAAAVAVHKSKIDAATITVQESGCSIDLTAGRDMGDIHDAAFASSPPTRTILLWYLTTIEEADRELASARATVHADMRAGRI
jgi:hypothetical protein